MNNDIRNSEPNRVAVVHQFREIETFEIVTQKSENIFLVFIVVVVVVVVVWCHFGNEQLDKTLSRWDWTPLEMRQQKLKGSEPGSRANIDWIWIIFHILRWFNYSKWLRGGGRRVHWNAMKLPVRIINNRRKKEVDRKWNATEATICQFLYAKQAARNLRASRRRRRTRRTTTRRRTRRRNMRIFVKVKQIKINSELHASSHV